MGTVAEQEAFTHYQAGLCGNSYMAVVSQPHLHLTPPKLPREEGGVETGAAPGKEGQVLGLLTCSKSPMYRTGRVVYSRLNSARNQPSYSG